MKIVGIDLKEVMELYEVGPNTTPCLKCGVVFKYVDYRFGKDMVSFLTESHECGDKFRVSKVKLKGELLKDFMEYF